MAKAALVLGIMATICPLLYSVSTSLIVLAIPLAMVAILLGRKARRRAIADGKPKGLATASLILGVLPLFLSVGMLLFYSRGVDAARDPAEVERLNKEHIKNSKEFDDIFKQTVQHDNKEKK